MWILIIAVYALLFIYEAVPLYKQKLWKELLVYLGLYAFSFTIALLIGIGVNLPSPAKPIADFIISIFGK